MSQYQQLLFGQLACFFVAGVLAVLSIKEYGFTFSAAPSLAVCAILAAIGWLGTQIIHELAEINDQLAGRLKEFQTFFNDLNKRS